MSKGAPPLSKEAKNIKIGIYQHFKGHKVEVIGIALHSETFEETVVYKHLTGEHAGEQHYWARPLKIFLEYVERDGYKGPRFKYVGK